MWTICGGWVKNCNHNVVKREVHGKKLEHEHKKGIGEKLDVGIPLVVKFFVILFEKPS